MPAVVLVLNMDRSPERLRMVTDNLAAIGVKAQRVPAIDGKTLSLPLAEVDPDEYRRCHGRVLRLAEVGCYLSHLKAMKLFLATDFRYCTILEDDAEVSPAIVDAINELIRCEMYEFDVVRFDYRRPGLGFDAAKLRDGRAIRVNFTRCTGTTGYMVSRHAAQRYLDRLLPMRVPFDHAFDRPLHLSLRIGNINPALVRPRKNVPSTISPTDRNRSDGKVGALRKIPVLLWRTETEIARGVYAARELLRKAWPTPQGNHAGHHPNPYRERD